MEKQKTSHVHAALMVQYAHECLSDDKAYLNWEVKIYSHWDTCGQHPRWKTNIGYRRKPEVPVQIHQALMDQYNALAEHNPQEHQNWEIKLHLCE